MAGDQGAGSGLRLGENRREADTPGAQHFGPGGKRALGLLRWQGHISWLDMEWSGPKPSPTQRPHQSTPVDALRQVTPPPRELPLAYFLSPWHLLRAPGRGKRHLVDSPGLSGATHSNGCKRRWQCWLGCPLRRKKFPNQWSASCTPPPPPPHSL